MLLRFFFLSRLTSECERKDEVTDIILDCLKDDDESGEEEKEDESGDEAAPSNVRIDQLCNSSDKKSLGDKSNKKVYGCSVKTQGMSTASSTVYRKRQDGDVATIIEYIILFDVSAHLS